MSKSIIRRRLTSVTACLSIVMLTAGLVLATPASAASLGSWSRSTTGASGSGTVSASNGYISNSLQISDTKADGSCAYVTTEWQHHDGLVMLWFKSDSQRSEVCGNGTTLFTTVRRSVDDIDAIFTDKLRVKVTVCRNVNNAFDNCSGSFLSQSYSV